MHSAENSATALNSLEDEINLALEYSNASAKLSNKTKNYSIEGQELGNVAKNAIDEVKQVSIDIVEYTRVINEIAERVSLLSLNASIEACKSGGKWARIFHCCKRNFKVRRKHKSKLNTDSEKKLTLLQKSK